MVEKLVCEGKGKGFGFWVLRYWQWLGLRIGGKVDGDRDMDVVAIPICYHFVYLSLASVMSEGVNSWVHHCNVVFCTVLISVGMVLERPSAGGLGHIVHRPKVFWFCVAQLWGVRFNGLGHGLLSCH